MRLCIYEDSCVSGLEPITLTRPAFALWCGAERLFERLGRQFAAREIGFWLRPALADLWRLERPDEPVNDADWARERMTVWTNGRWLPGPDVRIDATTAHVGMIGEQIAYVVIPAGESPDSQAIDAWLDGWRQRLPSHDTGGALLDSLWEVVEHNGDTLRRDGEWFHARRGSSPLPANVAIHGPAEQFIVAPGATVEPFVFADTRGGPVLIDDGAIVRAFTRLEGPCYVGRDSWIASARVGAGTTIGPCCRIGGEVEASIVQGYSNKAHDGFLGHSYVGEWVNLAAGTQTANLRIDYEPVRVGVNGDRRSTGRTKVGSFIGDHTKTGLGALLNAGSMVGAFASLLPDATLLPQVIPSFCRVRHGQAQDLWDLRSLFSTAERMMQRRGKTFTETHRECFYQLYEATMEQRHKIARASQPRRLRQSI